ncbi:MAG: glycosyltransferase family 2 protein [Phenylobacterium sp.]|uniref:glycosyltransferase family 2 protein n=1 Tax=Phenylobacterium sp. TaxID=1871053 RepID=UPI0039196B73
MKISVIVATRNRAGQVAPALESIVAAAQGAPAVEVEVVLVDNGSTDETAAVVAAEATRCPLRVIPAMEPEPGLSRARNLGLQKATGDVIAFTDDDCRMTPAYFADLARHYRKLEGPFVLGGRVELGDPADLPFTIKTDDQPARLGGEVHPGGFVHGANMTAPREVFDLVGRFDVRFGAGGRFQSAEDTDFLVRARRAGVPVLYAPDMAVRHFHGRRTLAEVRKLSRAYQLGNGALLAKHWRADPMLLKHLWWNGRNAAAELFGGRLFDPELGISHRDVFLANLRGLALYAAQPRPKTALAQRSAQTSPDRAPQQVQS